ncbi:aminotransferase class I/II-fold pyridoxal phosphate-dependent enzyme [Actinoplanes regularis]|uniref:8-amino-7-oxononanoate synthase n=1 Tax=Actinoplanes regularis TaxID=52697 RepID=A0A239BGF7_9ACTN|nr:aminotransferase class I/II-fold pyridoxal phosphate-dependent enzyme [Actinoplanes regularis]GIE87967.1 aminotransferase [Actinoplanes regularis]SNS06531.1 7-keto-8-aminopelargonate synthetase [Actinoplanes regularis]
MTQKTVAPPSNWVAARISKTSDMLDRAFDRGLTGHVITERNGKQVRLADDSTAIEFVSCSYLGLEQHPELVEAAHDALRRFGVHFSIARNRARPAYLPELEDLLGEIYPGTRAVVFGTVSSAHLGTLPLLGAGALPSYPIAAGGVTFLVEKTAHASMQVLRGVLEQLGPVRRFELNNPDGLTAELRAAAAANRTPVLLVDGVGSMGGLVDVRALHDTVTPYGGLLYVDDAHGTSITGKHGAGYAFEAFGGELPPGVLITGSLSKAFGGIGGVALVRDEADLLVLRKFANPLVFGQSVPVPMLAATVAAARLHLNGEVARRQELLWSNAAVFDELTNGALVNADLRCPIRGAHFDDEERAFAAGERLRDAGVLILPAFYPTVAEGTGLLRFALSSLHTRDQLAAAAAALAPALDGK